MPGQPPPANDVWWQVHIPGQRVHYGNWRVHYDPKPIPTRALDWSYWHKDFDGTEDACDNRYGSTPSLLAAINEIDDREDDQFDERGCEECPLATPTSCLKAGPCNHRDDELLRRRLRELVERAQ